MTAIVLACLLFTNGSADQAETQNLMQTSPLLKPWPGPYGGVPPWNEVRPEEFPAAFDAAMADAEAEIDQIAAQDEPATFANTIEALERVGQPLRRLESIFFVYTSNLNLGPIPDLEKSIVPKLSQHEDRIYQNKALFERIESVANADSSLSPAQKRLVDKLYKTFIRQGAKLNASEKAELSQINTRLARLFTEFSQNVLEDENGYVTWINDPADLSGLPDSTIAAMKAAADELNQSGGVYAVTNTRSSMDPFLTYADKRDLRQKVWTNYYNRGDNGDGNDNNQIIQEILRLRAQRAKLLGYPTHAHWRMEPTMAKTPDAALELMNAVWPKAVARVQQEVSDMQDIANQLGHDITIAPWDYRYYAEKVRKQKYDLDMNEVKPYLQLDKLTEGMMWAAGELYGLQFKLIGDLPVFHPDVTTYQVSDASGNFVGLWYLDPYARSGKRSGAWMTDYREQSKLDDDVRPIVSNNSNFIDAGDGPTLISWDDATTLFHEFGHALHSLLSQATYSSQAGTNVARDYVEFPSQLNEHWLDTDQILNRFAVHYQTGQPIPRTLVDKIKRASTFNQGFSTVEYLASALMDMKLHLAGGVAIQPDAFERETLQEMGMPSQLPMRHRTPHFSHIFSSDAYSAGYYSYLWADALTADAAEKFEEIGDYYDPQAAKSLYENIMSVGDTIDPAEGFRRFRGRDVDTDALLRKRGFPTKSDNE